MASEGTQQKARDFLEIAHQFYLGVLPTEQPHPKTKNLSELANHNLTQAVETLKEIDLEALEVLPKKLSEIKSLREDMLRCLAEGGRVFLSGCGATGRLALNLELLAELTQDKTWSGRLVSFMAGGDVALVHSLEGFEDFPEYGARHLMDLGFCAQDLLVAITEGGETPYVIGTVEKAAEISNHSPYFIYCNPDEILCQKVQRSKRVIENKLIKKINLSVGPMALSGSTRMQASTVLMAAVGLALFSPEERMAGDLEGWVKSYSGMDLSALESFIVNESECYKKKQGVVYLADDFTLPIFTDTTERSPTFNLRPIESKTSDKPSLFYVVIANEDCEERAWKHLLHRDPRPLNWPEVSEQATPEYFQSFDFSTQALLRRQKQSVQNTFAVRRAADGFEFDFMNQKVTFSSLVNHELFLQLNLKMALNIHSTLIMGRLKRYQGNLMTWVNPTNGKLIDRSARYIDILLRQKGVEVSYEEIIYALFEQIQHPDPEESLVLKTVQALVSQDS